MNRGVYDKMRAKKRYAVDLKASYAVGNRPGSSRQCRISNLSASGASIRLPDTENLKSGAVLVMDIAIPDTIMHVSTEAEIMWVRQRFNKLMCGLKFKSLLSRGMIEMLTQAGTHAGEPTRQGAALPA